MLQLFDADDAIQPIDARLLQTGVLTIGRDPQADWPIADPDRALSRTHCELRVDRDGLTLRVIGANGVFDDIAGSRFPDDVESPVSLPGALRLGRFRIVATVAPHAAVAGVHGDLTMVLSPPLGESIDVPSDWSGPAPQPATGEGSLLEAFCEGAGLDASLLSSEDPEEIMRRAGALYRQMVLGIGDLMAERNRARARYQLNRTTISGEGNNPFKWAPSQRLAVDLLLAGSSGFLSGPAAVQSSFRDVKLHLVATFAGMQGSLRYAVGRFDPEAIENAVAARPTLLKSRASLLTEEAGQRHAGLAAEMDGGAPGALDHAFTAAYDHTEAALNRGDSL
ncbi:type VI secretion system-associated FHA domain protein [Pelagerythrobacter sp.]|uniref:type VI secretion system-associated FHA domain protein n=1 Tax=Pelagerythrobacter sp. TaxID=2800702 RepID=UPI0035B23755